jgi:hypothetical protein
VAVLLPQNGGGGLLFGDGSGNYQQTRLEVLLRKEKSASSDFALGKRKKSAEAISGK